VTTFADVTAVTAMAPAEFKADISPRWTIVGHPNGGYLLAMIGRAVTELSAHPHVLAASAHFLRSPEPGPARIEEHHELRERSEHERNAERDSRRRVEEHGKERRNDDRREDHH